METIRLTFYTVGLLGVLKSENLYIQMVSGVEKLTRSFPLTRPPPPVGGAPCCRCGRRVEKFHSRPMRGGGQGGGTTRTAPIPNYKIKF